jgi:hypothetical protein
VCDSKGMDQRVRWLVMALALGLAASLACRDHGAEAGIGGQSGDEGRSVRAPWLGTGGVGSDQTLRR